MRSIVERLPCALMTDRDRKECLAPPLSVSILKPASKSPDMPSTRVDLYRLTPARCACSASSASRVRRLRPIAVDGNVSFHSSPLAAVRRALRMGTAPALRTLSHTPRPSSSPAHSGERNSPHSLSCGYVFASKSATRKPSRARVIAALHPAGPPPMMAVSKAEALIFLPPKSGAQASYESPAEQEGLLPLPARSARWLYTPGEWIAAHHDG